MATDKYTLEVEGVIDQYVAKVSQIPGITAKQIAKGTMAHQAAWIKSQQEMAAKVTAVARSTAQDVQKAMEPVGEEMVGGIGQSSAKVAGALSLISPAAADSARNVADLADVGEVAAKALAGLATTKGGMGALLSTLGPIGLAVGAATAAFMLYQEATEKAAKATEEAKVAADHARDAYNSLGSALFDAQVRQQELSGAISSTEAGVKRASHSIAEQYGPALAEAAQRMGAAKQAVADYRAELGASEGSTSSVRATMAELTATAADAEQTFNDLRGRYVALTATQTANITKEGEVKESKEATAKATRDAKVALKEYNDEYAKSVAAMDEDTTATQAVTAAIEQLGQAAKAADNTRLTGAAALRASRDQELSQLEQQFQTAMAQTSAAGDERQALLTAYEEARVAVAAKADREIEASAKERAAKDVEVAKAVAAVQIQMVNNVLDASLTASNAYLDARIAEGEALAAALTDSSAQWTAAQRADMEAQLKDQQDKATAAFYVTQALAATQAIMAAWTAAAEAYAATAALGPVGLALAPAAAGVAFAAVAAGPIAQIKSQEPPSFGDTPAVQQIDSSGLVRFARGDLFAAAQSPRELRRQVDNIAPPTRTATPQTVVVTQQRGTVVDERVNRFRVNGPGALSRRLDKANQTPGKRRK